MLLARQKAREPQPHGLAARCIRQSFGMASHPQFSWDSMPTIPRAPSLGCIICDVRGRSGHINSPLLPRWLGDTGRQRGQQLGWLYWSTALPSAKPAKVTARTRGAASPMSAVNSLPSGSWEFPKTKVSIWINSSVSKLRNHSLKFRNQIDSDYMLVSYYPNPFYSNSLCDLSLLYLASILNHKYAVCFMFL